MKWISKDKKSSLDLDKIGYWKYTSVDDVKKQNASTVEETKNQPGGFLFVEDEISRLEVYMSGDGPLTFKGEDADEIYEMLINKKEII